ERELRRLRDRADVRLDGEAQPFAARLLSAPLKLLRRAAERVVVALARPVDSRQDRQARRLEPNGELEHGVEEASRAVALARLRMVRRHRLEIGPGNDEDVADREAGRAKILADPVCRAGDVLADVFGAHDRAVAAQEEVDALHAERGDEVEGRPVRPQHPERVVRAGELHEPSSGLASLDFVIEKPPSAAITAPVTPRAASESRNSTTAPTACSSGSSAGRITFTVIPFSASSTAATCAAVVRNAPATPSSAAPAMGRAAAAVETNTIRPGPAWSRA